MTKQKSQLLSKYLTVFLLLSVTLLVSVASSKNIQISKVDRQSMLNSNYPTQQTLIDFKTTDTVSTYEHVIPMYLDDLVNKIVFMKSKDNKEMLPFARKQHIYKGQNYALYTVTLDRQYEAQQNGQLYIVTVFLNRYVNFPLQITMSEDQKFEYFDNKYFITPYKVKQQSNSYKFDKIISHDKDGEVKGLSAVVFKKSDVQPFTLQQHVVHGVNNDPQVYFSDVQRIIQVSHWGNIAITEFYKLKNVGPTHKGQFSRIQFGSRSQADAKHAFRGIQSQISYDAWGLYYRDQVGNVTTSVAFRDQYSKKVKLTLVPRFLLLGGWKSNWEIGYNLPTDNFLHNQGDHFQIDNINLEYTLQKIITQNYDFKIILPEGSTGIKVKAGGKQIDPTRIQKSYGYLDFFGRPAYVFQNYKGILKKKDITVDYHVSTLSTLYKPLTIFAILFSILAILIVMKRLKFDAFKQEKLE